MNYPKNQPSQVCRNVAGGTDGSMHVEYARQGYGYKGYYAQKQYLTWARYFIIKCQACFRIDLCIP